MLILNTLFLFTINIVIINATERYLDAPKLLSVSSVEPPGLHIIWDTVKQKESDPVIGYKIKIATIKSTTHEKFDLISGDQEPGYTVVIKPVDVFNINKTYDTDVKEIVASPRTTEIIVRDLKYNEFYEVRVLAFKADYEGPMSDPMRVKITKFKTKRFTVKRLTTGCFVSIPGIISNMEYPFYHNSYF